jgi:hypothetical protein
MSAARAKQLTGDVKVLQDAANVLTAESSKRARRTANATGAGVFLLVAIGIAAGLIGSRRVRTSVEDLRTQNRHLEQLRDELTNVKRRAPLKPSGSCSAVKISRRKLWHASLSSSLSRTCSLSR